MAAPNTPKTWSSAEVVTAANMNSYVRDQQEWLLGSGTNAKPSCRVYNSANISHTTSGSAQTLTFDSERWDTGGMHSTVSNTSRITIPSGCGGKYLIGTNIGWASNGTGYREVQFLVGGTLLIAATTDVPNSSTTHYQHLETLLDMAAGSYVEVYVNQTSGSALNVVSDAGSHYRSPEFWAIWMAA